MTSVPPHNPDDLDRLLAGFFQQQMPDPWPECRALTEAPQAEVRGLYQQAGTDPLNHSRYTLAASVALLLGLGIYATSGLQPAATVATPAAKTVPANLLNKASADGSKLLNSTRPMP